MKQLTCYFSPLSVLGSLGSTSWSLSLSSSTTSSSPLWRSPRCPDSARSSDQFPPPASTKTPAASSSSRSRTGCRSSSAAAPRPRISSLLCIDCHSPKKKPESYFIMISLHLPPDTRTSDSCQTGLRTMMCRHCWSPSAGVRYPGPCPSPGASQMWCPPGVPDAPVFAHPASPLLALPKDQLVPPVVTPDQWEVSINSIDQWEASITWSPTPGCNFEIVSI